MLKLVTVLMTAKKCEWRRQNVASENAFFIVINSEMEAKDPHYLFSKSSVWLS